MISFFFVFDDENNDDDGKDNDDENDGDENDDDDDKRQIKKESASFFSFLYPKRCPCLPICSLEIPEREEGRNSKRRFYFFRKQRKKKSKDNECKKTKKTRLFLPFFPHKNKKQLASQLAARRHGKKKNAPRNVAGAPAGARCRAWRSCACPCG